MKRSKFTEQQIALALKQALLGTFVEEVCRKLDISDATFYNWKKKYGGLGLIPERQRLVISEVPNQVWALHFTHGTLYDGR